MIMPATLIVLTAVAALLTILAPFGTGERLTFALRFAYWLAMTMSTYSAGFLTDALLKRRLPPAMALLFRIGALALATALAITPVITLINLIAFGYWPSLSEWPVLLAQFAAIALITTVIFQAVSWQTHAQSTKSDAPALLSRLPLDKRGPLVSLSSEDHYTRVRTDRGEELILIRLADAMAETEPTPGLRVHRSHWVATQQVHSVARKGDGAVLSMAKGDDIPVSRSHMQAIRDAGLMPR